MDNIHYECTLVSASHKKLLISIDMSSTQLVKSFGKKIFVHQISSSENLIFSLNNLKTEFRGSSKVHDYAKFESFFLPQIELSNALSNPTQQI